MSLAALQYRWIGTVSEAEREEMKQSLDRRARDFGTDFDREIVKTFALLEANADHLDVDRPEIFAARTEEWRRTNATSPLVSALYFAREREGGYDVFAYSPDTRTFRATEWPAALIPIKTRLDLRSKMTSGGTRGTNVTGGVAITAPVMTMMTLPSIMYDVPALIVPVRSRTIEAEAQKLDQASRRRVEETLARSNAQGRGGMFGTMSTFEMRVAVDHNYLVAQIDPEFVRQTMLPALASKHFPDAERYRVAILDASNKPALTRILPARQSIAPERADAVYPFFQLRSDLPDILWAFATPSAAGAPGGTVVARPAPPPPALEQRQQVTTVTVAGPGAPPGARTAAFRVGQSWRILLQHADGSLDAAVAHARLKNLYLSFGILATLLISVGLIVFNARRSERLAAQQMDFVATVSHELRTPLAVIRSAAQNLSAGVVHESDQARRYGDLIEAEGRRLTDMVEQVLEYAGMSGNRGPRLARVPDLGHVVKDVVESSAGLIESSGFTAEVAVSPDLPAVLADEDAVRRALTNLITNALKYGADGRWIGISARRVTVKGQQEVELAVSDRGRGIEPQDLAHIFEPFFRGRPALERQIHGNGLGLSLVKRIAESHGGRIAVKSVPGEGATFTLNLPAAPPKAAAGDS